VIPKSLSATALDTAMTCMARYHAEKFQRTPTPSGDAALRGSTVHGALEVFVRKAVVEKSLDWEWEILEAMLMVSFKETFDISDLDSEQWKDVREMTWRWFNRTDVREPHVEVVSLELRQEFEVATSVGSIPFTFIIDRLDRIGPGIYRVVDYKSIRAFISSEDLRSKIQARAYALAVQIVQPDAQEIHVEFDMVRHDTRNPSTIFTREDNAATWYRIIEEVEKIIAADETARLPETLNNECMYCVRKSECETLIKHAAGGGVFGKTPDQAVELKYKVQSALKALRSLNDELDGIILAKSQADDTFKWRVGDIEVKITASKKRTPDIQGILRILPEEVKDRYANLTLGQIDALLKSGEISDELALQIESMITQGYGDPSPKVSSKPII